MSRAARAAARNDGSRRAEARRKERERVPATIRKHRRNHHLDWIAEPRAGWRQTPTGWAPVGGSYEVVPTGDKLHVDGYRVLRNTVPIASFSSPEAALDYVEWRTHFE
jgi:hypothetical protein